MAQPTEFDREAQRSGALAHTTRLKTFQYVLASGRAGITAGELARSIGVTPSNLSAHLAILVQAGLLNVTALGRLRIFTAAAPQIRELVAFLAETCCELHPDLQRS